MTFFGKDFHKISIENMAIAAREVFAYELEKEHEMTKPLTTEIAPLSSVAVTYDPGIVVYKLRLVNSNGETQAAVVSFDRISGTLTVLTTEKGV